MKVLLGVFIVLAWCCIFVLMRGLTTFLHEMGHAIPALIFSDKRVQVFIGSYGDKKNSYKVELGRLKLWLTPKITTLGRGLCIADRSQMSFGQQLVQIIGGPLASVIIGGLALWAVIRYSDNDIFFVIAIAFLSSAIWDLFVNMSPRAFGTSILDVDNGYVSDGMLLLLLFRERRLPDIYHKYAKQVKDEEYQPLLDRVEQGIENGTVEESLLPLAIVAYEATGEYGGALSIYEYWHKQRPLEPQDYFKLGELYRKLSNYQEAINCYGAYLHDFFTDYKAIQARGVCYQQMGEHGAAIQEFTVSLRYNDQQAAVWRNRAYSLFRLNEFEDAESDLEVAQQLEPDHPRWFLYRSFLLEASSKYGEAHTALLKAKELGDDFHGLEFRLSELERRL